MKNSGITRNKINILFNFRQEIKLRKTVNSHLNSFDATASRQFSSYSDLANRDSEDST